MATSDPKYFLQAASSAARKPEHGRSLQGGGARAGRAWPLTSLARSVRNTTAVLIDAVMGRYDR
jgi:hypothetical protein